MEVVVNRTLIRNVRIGVPVKAPGPVLVLTPMWAFVLFAHSPPMPRLGCGQCRLQKYGAAEDIPYDHGHPQGYDPFSDLRESLLQDQKQAQGHSPPGT